MGTPITVPYVGKILYTETGVTHKMEVYIPGLANVSSDSFDTITLTGGNSSGSTLTAAFTALINAMASHMNASTVFQLGELYSYSSVKPNLTPIAAKTFSISGTFGSAAVLGSQLAFVMRKGRCYGRFQLMDFTTVPPARYAPPRFGGSGPFDSIFAIFNAQQYFSLRNGLYPDTAFGVSLQYNARELRARGLRP